YDTGTPAIVTLAKGRVAQVASLPSSHKPEHDLPWVAPGFVDVQVNGFEGQEFSSQELTAEKVARIVRRHFAFGVTGICPTLTTQSFACLAHGMRAIDEACQSYADVGQAVLGIHLEGPYFSTEDGPRGAHPKEHCRRPDWDEFQRLQAAAGGR